MHSGSLSIKYHTSDQYKNEHHGSYIQYHEQGKKQIHSTSTYSGHIGTIINYHKQDTYEYYHNESYEYYHPPSGHKEYYHPSNGKIIDYHPKALEWYHDQDTEWYHKDGHKEKYHPQGGGYYHSKGRIAYHPGSKYWSHPGSVERYHTSTQYTRRSNTSYKWFLWAEWDHHTTYGAWKRDCCGAVQDSYEDDRGCARRWSCCEYDSDDSGCEQYFDCCYKKVKNSNSGCEYKWQCCNKTDYSDEGCCYDHLCCKKWDDGCQWRWSCCQNPTSDSGCELRYKCCYRETSDSGCERRYACCQRSQYSDGCSKKWNCCSYNEHDSGCKRRWSCCSRDENDSGCNTRYKCCKASSYDSGCKKRYPCCHRDYDAYDDGNNGCMKKYSGCGCNDNANGCADMCSNCDQAIYSSIGCIEKWKCCDAGMNNQGCKWRWNCCDNSEQFSVGCQKRYICCDAVYPDLYNATACGKKYDCCNKDEKEQPCKLKYKCCQQFAVEIGDVSGCQSKWNCCNTNINPSLLQQAASWVIQTKAKGCTFRYKCCMLSKDNAGIGCKMLCDNCSRPYNDVGCCKVFSGSDNDKNDDEYDNQKLYHWMDDNIITMNYNISNKKCKEMNDICKRSVNEVENESTKVFIKTISNSIDTYENCFTKTIQTLSKLNKVKSMVSKDSEMSKLINKTIDVNVASRDTMTKMNGEFIDNFITFGKNMTTNDDEYGCTDNKLNEIYEGQWKLKYEYKHKIEDLKKKNLNCATNILEKKIGVQHVLSVKESIPEFEKKHTNSYIKYYQSIQERNDKIRHIKTEIETLKQLKSDEITDAIRNKKTHTEIEIIRNKYNTLIENKQNELMQKNQIFENSINKNEMEMKNAQQMYTGKVNELKRFGELMGIKDDKKLVTFLKHMSEILQNLHENDLRIDQIDIDMNNLYENIQRKFSDKIKIEDRFPFEQTEIGIFDLSEFIDLFVNKNGFIFMRDLMCQNSDKEREYKKDILKALKINYFIKEKKIKNKQHKLYTLKKYCIEEKWDEYEKELNYQITESVKDLSIYFGKIYGLKYNNKTDDEKNDSKVDDELEEKEYKTLLNAWYLSKHISEFEKHNFVKTEDIKQMTRKKLKKILRFKIGEIRRFEWNHKIYFGDIKHSKTDDDNKENNTANKIYQFIEFDEENDNKIIISNNKKVNCSLKFAKLIRRKRKSDDGIVIVEIKNKSVQSVDILSVNELLKQHKIASLIDIFNAEENNIDYGSWKLVAKTKSKEGNYYLCEEMGINEKDRKLLKSLCKSLEKKYKVRFDE